MNITTLASLSLAAEQQMYEIQRAVRRDPMNMELRMKLRLVKKDHEDLLNDLQAARREMDNL